MNRNHYSKYAELYHVNQTGLPFRHRSLWCVGHSTRIILDYSSASFRIFLSDHSKHLADLFKLLQCHEAHLWFYRVEEVDNLLGPNVSGRDTIYFMPSTLSTRKSILLLFTACTAQFCSTTWTILKQKLNCAKVRGCQKKHSFCFASIKQSFKN